MIDTIIFDAEGVVIDTEPMWDKAQEEFLRRRGLVYEREKVKHLLSGRSIVEGTGILKQAYGFSGDTDELVCERMELVKAQIESGVSFVSGFYEFYSRIKPRFKAAIATALAEELLRGVDRRLGLFNLFANHVYSLRHVNYRSKPNPDLFLFAAARLGADPCSCLVIEDAPHGVEAARRAGMRCVALTTTYSAATLSAANVIVSSFGEIDLDSPAISAA